MLNKTMFPSLASMMAMVFLMSVIVCKPGMTLAASVTYVSGGGGKSLILKSDGSVWAWGANLYGGLGDNTVSLMTGSVVTTNNDKYTPIQVHGPNNAGYLNAVEIVAGEYYNFARKSDGTVWSWGRNINGELGIGVSSDHSAVPVQVSGLTSVTSLGGRGYHSMAIKSDGSVWTWGCNWYGEIGNGSTSGGDCANPSNDMFTPYHVTGLSGSASIVSGGGFYSLALMQNGTLWAWGDNRYGQLGDGSTTDRHVPVQINISNVSKISAGFYQTVALKADGTVWTWGRNTNGEIGDNTTNNRLSPYQVAGLIGMIMTSASAGDCHSGALKNDGTVWTWGCNMYGQLGDGTFNERHTPAQVPGLSNVVLYYARDHHNIALTSDGTVWTWGENAFGQIGNGSTTPYTVGSGVNTPVKVAGLGGTSNASVPVFDKAGLLLLSLGSALTIGYYFKVKMSKDRSI